MPHRLHEPLMAALLAAVIVVSVSPSAASALPRLAVMDLKAGEGLSEDQARTMTGLLRSAIYETRAFEMINREDMESIAENYKIESYLCADDECLLVWGELLGAQKLVAGDVGQVLDGQYIVNIRMVDLAGNKLTNDLVKSSDPFAKDGDIVGVMERLAAQVAGKAVWRDGGLRTDRVEAPRRYEPEGDTEAFVRFESDPSGATVVIPRQGSFQTPVTLAILPGLYTVEMTLPGYQSRRDEVIVRDGMKPLKWKLKPDFGWLTVTSDPSGLPVRINGAPVGSTPLTRKQYPRGVYQVTLADERYHGAEEKVRISPEKEEKVSFSPVPRMGGIKIRATDRLGSSVAGRVRVDGRDVGRTYEPIAVLIGRHRVEVVSNLDTWVETVDVEEGRTVTLEARITGGEPGKQYATGSLAEQALAIHSRKALGRKKTNTVLMTGALIAGLVAVGSHAGAEAQYESYMESSLPEDLDKYYGDYESFIETRNIAIYATGGLVALRLLMELFPVPSEEDIYRQLLAGDRVGLRFAPGDDGSVRLALGARF